MFSLFSAVVAGIIVGYVNHQMTKNDKDPKTIYIQNAKDFDFDKSKEVDIDLPKRPSVTIPLLYWSEVDAILQWSSVGALTVISCLPAFYWLTGNETPEGFFLGSIIATITLVLHFCYLLVSKKGRVENAQSLKFFILLIPVCAFLLFVDIHPNPDRVELTYEDIPLILIFFSTFYLGFALKNHHHLFNK